MWIINIFYNIILRALAFGRGFFPLWTKKGLSCFFGPYWPIYWCSVVTLVTFSSNLGNFENKKIQHQNKSKESKHLKISKNLEIWRKETGFGCVFFFIQRRKEENNFEQQNAVLLVLLFKEISLQTELSSPPRFRIQGGVVWASRTDGRKLSCLILDCKEHIPRGICSMFFEVCDCLKPGVYEIKPALSWNLIEESSKATKQCWLP